VKAKTGQTKQKIDHSSRRLDKNQLDLLQMMAVISTVLWLPLKMNLNWIYLLDLNMMIVDRGTGLKEFLYLSLTVLGSGHSSTPKFRWELLS